MNSKLCISISGGGALGIGPAWFLSKIEAELGTKFISENCCGFAGTSTGSIIAALLAEGYSAYDIFTLYKQFIPKIFTKYPWYKRILPTCPVYDNSELKKMLKKHLNSKCKFWTKQPTFVTSTFMNGESVEKVWDNCDEEEKWFAVLTSTAAPTYFDVIVDESGRSFCDGGMWSNSCPDILMAGMFNGGQRDIRILNLETGMDAPPARDKGNKTYAGWAKYIFKNWVARSSRSPAYVCKAVLGYNNFMDVMPITKEKFDMDDLKITDKVIKIWDMEFERNKDKIIEFVRG